MCGGVVERSMRLLGGVGNKILPLWIRRISARVPDLRFTHFGSDAVRERVSAKSGTSYGGGNGVPANPLNRKGLD